MSEITFESRIERLINSLSILSVGEFDQLLTIDLEGREDQLAMLEETVNVLGREFAEAKMANERYLNELRGSRQALEEKLQTIERQQLAIRDLSTPIIELWEDILTLPIVGIVDSQRSIDMTERLLHRIRESRARCVIIDITGVDVVDTMTADHFVRMIRSAQMLGAHCVVTGISPEIAQTLIRINVDLGTVQTLLSLKEGLKECFHYLRGRENDRARSRSR